MPPSDDQVVSTFLGPLVTLVRESFSGELQSLELYALDALDRLENDPDNGVIWRTAHIYQIVTNGEQHLGYWDRSA